MLKALYWYSVWLKVEFLMMIPSVKISRNITFTPSDHFSSDESFIVSMAAAGEKPSGLDVTCNSTHAKHVSKCLYIFLSAGQQGRSVIRKAASSDLIVLYSFLCYKQVDWSGALLSPTWPRCGVDSSTQSQPLPTPPSQSWMRGWIWSQSFCSSCSGEL